MGRRGIVDVLKNVVAVRGRHVGGHADSTRTTGLVITVDGDTGETGSTFGHGSGN